MKCPLKRSEIFIASDHSVYNPADCLKDECAWWQDAVDQCAILSLAVFCTPYFPHKRDNSKYTA